ncbi:unnamed protein product [Brassica rapa]|uniref:Uncharacterized protein n=1 Tax=Brassica campestris TaxID=3711 RepID=A0A8D9CR79_BRACM|nr:unnamed protein product [Brassica rapa]
MSYKMLPQYLHVLKLTNPGTITDIKTKLDREGKLRFMYAFMSLKACIDGWQHLRKVLVVDGTHMFRKYKGVLLSRGGHFDADCRYKRMDQKQMVARAADAFKVSEFQKIYDLINLTDWRCWDYLEKIDKKLWTRSHFEGTRFNLMTSNIVESLNKALLPARDSPIMALLEFIRRMLTRWFECRRYYISKMQENILKIIDEIVVEQLVLSTGLLFLPCSTW